MLRELLGICVLLIGGCYGFWHVEYKTDARLTDGNDHINPFVFVNESYQALLPYAFKPDQETWDFYKSWLSDTYGPTITKKLLDIVDKAINITMYDYSDAMRKFSMNMNNLSRSMQSEFTSMYPSMNMTSNEYMNMTMNEFSMDMWQDQYKMMMKYADINNEVYAPLMQLQNVVIQNVYTPLIQLFYDPMDYMIISKLPEAMIRTYRIGVFGYEIDG